MPAPPADGAARQAATARGGIADAPGGPGIRYGTVAVVRRPVAGRSGPDGRRTGRSAAG